MTALLRRLRDWFHAEMVQPDPWEPPLAIGQIILREKTTDKWVPGRVLGIFNSQAELSAFLGCSGPMDSYWVTVRHQDGSYSSADRRHLWHLLATYEAAEPTISFEEAAAMIAAGPAA